MGKKHKNRGRQGGGYGPAYGVPPQYGAWPPAGWDPSMAMPGYGYAGRGGGHPAHGDDTANPEDHACGGHCHGGSGYGAPQYGTAGGHGGYGSPDYGAAGVYGGYGGPGFGPMGANRDFLRGMSAYLPSHQTEQFLMGLMIGAGAAWLLSDEEMRGKLIKAGMKLYASIAGGFEELKEQMGDIRAEVDAERHGDDGDNGDE